MNKFKLASLNIAIAIKIIMIIAALVIIGLFIIAEIEYQNARTNKCENTGQRQQEYNSKIKMYLNKEGVKGSEIQSLIDNIISQNQENVYNNSEFIGIKLEGNLEANYENSESLKEACEKANMFSYDTGEIIRDADNTIVNVSNAVKQMEELKKYINNDIYYSTNEVYDTFGFIVWVKISETEKGEENENENKR